MSGFRGLFKTGTTEETPTNNSDNSTKVVSGFFAGTSNFFNSVQAKKDDLMSDISSKLGNLAPFGEEEKEAKVHDDDNDSSASEYGDGGDKPVYQGLKEGRRLSLDSVDSLPEDESKRYKSFVFQLSEDIFNRNSISESAKSTFSSYCKHHTARSNFAKEMDKKKLNHKKVSDRVMQNTVDCFNIVLPECDTAEDFRPARLLMNLCFTFYTEAVTDDGCPVLTYLYTKLRRQPICQSIRFWNAAFFESLGQERAKKPEPITEDVEKALTMDKEFQENVAFSQLSTFTWNMVAMGLSREVVLDFLRKQAAVANLPRDKYRLIQANIQKWTS